MRGKRWVLPVLFALATVSIGCGTDTGIRVPAVGQIVSGEDIEQSTDGAEKGVKQVPEENVGSAENTQQAVQSTGDVRKNVDSTQENSGSADVVNESENSSETTGEVEDSDVNRTNSDDFSILISAAGDVTMGNYLGQNYSYTFDDTYEKCSDKNYFFSHVKEIFAADDMTIVNLEGPLTMAEEPAPGRTFNIKGKPEYAVLLPAAGIEAVSMGNNHRLDYQEAGTADTVEALKENGIVYAYDGNVGIYETDSGIRIGYVSVNEVAWGTGVEKFLKKGIAKVQEEGVDLIFTCCHWGIEREYYPEDYQKELGRKCIDWGADLVIGHHPHVLQGIECYRGKYILYSLGNFCFGANKNPSDKDTMIFQQKFVPGEDGKMIPGEAKVIPCSISSVSNRNDYCPTPATDQEAERILERINEYSKEFGVYADEEGILRDAGAE